MAMLGRAVRTNALENIMFRMMYRTLHVSTSETSASPLARDASTYLLPLSSASTRNCQVHGITGTTCLRMVRGACSIRCASYLSPQIPTPPAIHQGGLVFKSAVEFFSDPNFCVPLHYIRVG